MPYRYRWWMVTSVVASVLGSSPRASKADIVLTARTSDYAISFGDSTLANAAVAYKISDAFSGNAGDSEGYTFTTKPLATGVYVAGSGDMSVQGFTVVDSTTATYTILATATGVGVVTEGYNVAAGADFSQSWVVAGITNGLHTLEFRGDGSENFTGFPFTVNIHIAGDWTSVGDGPGQIEFLSTLDPGWSYAPLTYDSGTNTTLLEASTQNYTGGNGNIDFLLNGPAVIPEPASLVLLAIGCGLAAATSSRGASVRRVPRPRGFDPMMTRWGEMGGFPRREFQARGVRTRRARD